MLKVLEAEEVSLGQVLKTVPDHLFSGKALVIADCAAGWLFLTPDLSWGRPWEASQVLEAQAATVVTQQEREGAQPSKALGGKHSGSVCCSCTQSEPRTSTFGLAAPQRAPPQSPCSGLALSWL